MTRFGTAPSCGIATAESAGHIGGEQANALAEGHAGSDWETGRFWAAGLKTLEAFALLAAGDVEHARRLLAESRGRLEPSVTSWVPPWS
jgi:hypothetical protein